MECVYALRNSSQKRDSEGVAKPKTKSAAYFKIQPSNVDLKITGDQTEIFWETGSFKPFKLPATRLVQ